METAIMIESLSVFFLSVAAITLAEMGDKTQLLAMAFATRYRATYVLIGVFIATVLNHALAVVAGTLLANIPGGDTWVQSLAAMSFIFFGLWTIRGDTLDGEDKKVSRYGPIVTVGIAFFIAEMGDKTQVTTISLAATYAKHPGDVLLGTTTGMLIADAIGIVIGVVMHKHIPEATVKLVSAAMFILFGFWKTWEVLTGKFSLCCGSAAACIGSLAFVTGLAVSYLLYSQKKPGTTTPQDGNPG
jgi:putative Ca2+/H+ antiporter (TMEM165/GDT1 family)